jgi:7-cyano-7-deazaguanine reductase
MIYLFFSKGEIMRNENELKEISLLGNQNTKYLFDCPNYEILETFENKHKERDYLVQFSCPEFTSLCPKTKQPDYATIFIRYIPDEKMVESKSLKLYLFSYRNHGDFHEDCTNLICNDLVKAMNPRWIRVIGDFAPRGGISITTVAEYKNFNFSIIPSHFLAIPENLHTRHKS